MDELINFIKSVNSNSVILTDEIMMKLSELNTTFLSKVDELSLSQKIFSEAFVEEAYPEIWPGPLSHTIENLFSMMHHANRKHFRTFYACFWGIPCRAFKGNFHNWTRNNAEKYIWNIKILPSTNPSWLLKAASTIADNFLNTQYISIDELLIFCDELEKISKFNERLQNPVIMNFEFDLRSTDWNLNKSRILNCSLARNRIISSL